MCVLCTCIILEGSVLVVRSFDIANFSLEIDTLEIPPRGSLKVFRKETVREVLHDLIWSMKRLGSMDTRWRTVPFFVSLNFTAELVECISLWRVKVKVYRAIYLTGNPGELHTDHLHVLLSLLLLYVNIDQNNY